MYKQMISKRFMTKKSFVSMSVLLLCFLFIIGSGLALSGSVFADIKSDIPADGRYTVEAVLKGGSGRVSIESPVSIESVQGKMTATLIWSSSFYEYMMINGEKHLPESRDVKGDTTTFRIPLSSLETLEFVAQTSKMSRPHDIEYSIVFDRSTLKKNDNSIFSWMPVVFPSLIILIALTIIIMNKMKRNKGIKVGLFLVPLLLLTIYSTGCVKDDIKPGSTYQNSIEGVSWIESEEVAYAEGFKIDYFERDIALIQIQDRLYLVIPRNTIVDTGSKDESKADDSKTIRVRPELKNAIIIRRPEKIYLTAPSALALIHDMGGMSKVRYTGTKKDSWALDFAVEAMDKGEMLFTGKYSSPDFERLIDEKCDLAVFSTMITHAPEIGEKFVELGVPVFIDYSSFEGHPLGRTEWIKVYGAILNKRQEAEKIFSEQRQKVEKLVENPTPKEKTVALFTISPSGRISARRYDDYVSKMIDISGGKYAYHNVTDVQFSAMNIVMEPEIFFQETSKADIVIYNTTIHGGFENIAAMTQTHPILSDIPAVKSGNVWVTTKSFFQSSTSHGNMIVELNQIIKGEADENTELEFFKKLK